MQTHHLTAMSLFALLVSIAFAALGQRTPAARLRRAAVGFALFMAFAIGVAWLFYSVSS